MRGQAHLAAACAALLATGLFAGCGKSGASSKDQGKTYAPDKKSGKGESSGGSGGSAAPPPTDADTTSGRPSAASDAGSQDATKGQAVTNPGAPVAHSPGKH